MTNWEAFLLGLVQGITEFLPISSSGHLALSQHLLGFTHLENFILFNLVCHLGTLCAIFVVFFSVIKENLTLESVLLRQIGLATLPLFPLVLILKPLKELFNRPELLGPFFLISSFILFSSVFLKFRSAPKPQKKWKDSLTIGLFQAVAIVPGISRSGATISAARLLGWQKEQAIQFSFILAIPTILGGVALEGLQVWKTPNLIQNITFFPYIIGFFISFLVGLGSLKLLIRFVVKDKWVYFGWYCLILGLMTTLYFNFIV